ncbi:MAG: hypothetical protein LW832_07490 [Parachlamydia sp.]|jgi:hypothetical protein|nr:hypothetical protein [Parachlamydia sp.]
MAHQELAKEASVAQQAEARLELAKEAQALHPAKEAQLEAVKKAQADHRARKAQLVRLPAEDRDKPQEQELHQKVPQQDPKA